MEDDEDLTQILEAANDVVSCDELESVASISSMIKLSRKRPKPVLNKRRSKNKLSRKNANVTKKNDLADVAPDETARDTLRGVQEPNVWARKVCRDRQNVANEFQETLTIYRRAEPRMYQIGTCYDKILNSLKTPLVVKLDSEDSGENFISDGTDVEGNNPFEHINTSNFA